MNVMANGGVVSVLRHCMIFYAFLLLYAQQKKNIHQKQFEQRIRVEHKHHRTQIKYSPHAHTRDAWRAFGGALTNRESRGAALPYVCVRERARIQRVRDTFNRVCVCVRVCLRAMRYGPFKLHKRVPTKTQQVCYIRITPRTVWWLAATARTALHSALWWCFNRDEQQSSHDIMIMLA